MQITVTRTLKLEEKRCPARKKRFTGPLVKKYCSRECLNRADYERNAEARRAPSARSLPRAEGARSGEKAITSGLNRRLPREVMCLV